MADPLADIERLVAMFRAAGSRDTEMQAEIADILAVLEKPDDSKALAEALAGLKIPQPQVNVTVPAPQVSVSPVLRSEWKSLSVTLVKDRMGATTGMTLTKV